MDLYQLKEYIIEPVLKVLRMYSVEAVEQVIGTVCQESLGGRFIKQLNNGPALGIYQMEPDTARDIIGNYLKYRPELYGRVFSFFNERQTLEENLKGNLYFQTAMCRVHYYRCKGAIPKDLEGQAVYWKNNYNTHLGKGTVEEYIENYNKLY
tara:strand:- start:425 stop:880 length:456 start_codon:yes stop_codon:yes gene_type:complete